MGSAKLHVTNISRFEANRTTSILSRLTTTQTRYVPHCISHIPPLHTMFTPDVTVYCLEYPPVWRPLKIVHSHLYYTSQRSRTCKLIFLPDSSKTQTCRTPALKSYPMTHQPRRAPRWKKPRTAPTPRSRRQAERVKLGSQPARPSPCIRATRRRRGRRLPSWV